MAGDATSTRRGLLALGAGALALSGCGGDDDEPSRARGPTREAQASTLNSTLAWEHAVIAAYRACEPHVSGADARALAAILEQEVGYAERLTELVRRYGGEPAPARARAEYERGFPELRDATEVLAFASDVEERSVRKFLEALPRVGGADLRRPLAEIAVDQGRHLAIVRALAGEDPAPHAFVTGTQ